MSDDSELPVIVVGAGPVGLSAAIALRSLGLPTVVLEADDRDRERPGSRALFVHRESLRLLGTGLPGLDRRLTDFGVTWRTKRTFYRGREVYSRTYRPGGPATAVPFTSLRQRDTERFLRDACDEAGAEVRWSSPVRDVRSGPASVEVTTAGGATVTGSHVIAADGARSAVRRALGITMSGDSSEGFHTTVDIADPEFLLERWFHYHHPRLGGRHVMTIPFAGGFQIDVQCGPNDEADEFGSDSSVREWLPRIVDRRHLDNVMWIANYRFTQVLADTFTDEHRRVLLVGEAAHLFPPLGARGMNSGIADAFASADAIALARVATAPERAHAVVEDVARRRRGAARRNDAAVREALAHLRPRRRRTVARQRVAAALSPVVPRCGTWLENATYGPATPATDADRY